MMVIKTENDAAGETIAPFRTLTEDALCDIRRLHATVPSTRSALALLFAIDAAQMEPSEGWVGFFVETACAHLVWDERPTGMLVAKDADWVLSRFDDAPSVSLVALMVRLVEEAHRVPADFEANVRRRASLFTSRQDRERTSKRPRSVPYLRLVA